VKWKYLRWSSRSVWITEGSSDVRIQCMVSTRSDQLYSWTGNNIYYSDVMLPQWISVLKWNNICCYTEQFATRNILKQLHISELFQEEEFSFLSSLCADRWTFDFSTIIVEGASVISNIVDYCMWLTCVHLIHNHILLEISGFLSSLIGDSTSHITVTIQFPALRIRKFVTS